jgi:hypothetical protein
VAYGIVHYFPGGTKEQYEASIGTVHPSDGSLPEGQFFHVAGPSGDGWVIVAIHDSQESWERFRDEKLIGLSTFAVYNHQEEEAAFPPEWTEHDVSDPGIT